MSATGRGRIRHKDDYYRTEAWAVKAILPRLGKPKYVLDPGAGDGAISRVVREELNPESLLCIEMDPGRVYRLRQQGFQTQWCNYLHWSPLLVGDCKKYDLIIGNPPYKLAMPFIQHSLRWLESGGKVAMLLGISFMASKKRRVWHEHNRSIVNILERRPSFTEDGGTDARDYAWFVWSKEGQYLRQWDVLECP